jgi:CAAX prenyl protease-like protein
MNLSHPALPRVVPFAIYILLLALGGLVDEAAFDKRWLYPAQVGLVAAALAFFWRRYDELLRPGPLPGGFWALAIITGVVVFVLWVRMDLPWMVLGEGGAGYDPRDDGKVNVLLAAFRIAGAAVVVPVMEELFWRSFVMRWIDKPQFLSQAATATSLKALLVSSVVFGFEHHLWLAGIVAGLAYGWLYRATGNLWVPVISHAVTNGMLGMWVLYTGAWQFW